MMSMSVCLSVCVFVCPQSYLGNYTSDFHPIFYACYLWHSDMLRTSGFMDVTMFVHKPRFLDVATEMQCTCSLGLGYKLCAVMPVAGQRTHGITIWAL